MSASKTKQLKHWYTICWNLNSLRKITGNLFVTDWGALDGLGFCGVLAIVGRRAISSCTLNRRKRGIDRLNVCGRTKEKRLYAPNYATDASIRASNWPAVTFQEMHCGRSKPGVATWRRLWHQVRFRRLNICSLRLNCSPIQMNLCTK